MLLDVSLSDLLIEFHRDNAAVFDIEESLLSLGSSGMVDGLFYSCVMKVERKDKPAVYIARYFEYGAFNGYFVNNAHRYLKEFLEVDELLPYCAYTPKDIDINKDRDETLFSKRKKTGKF